MKKFICISIAVLMSMSLFIGCEKAEKQEEQVIESVQPSISVEAKPLLKSYERTFTKEELQTDFDKMKSIIESKHPKLYADESKLKEMMTKQRELIQDGMTELQFYRLVSPVVSLLNCGHTSISLSTETEEYNRNEGKFFPLVIRWIDEQVFVTQNSCAPIVPIGAELLSINGKTVSDIRKLLLSNLTSDGSNETLKINYINNWFIYFYRNIVDEKETYEITYRIKDNDDIVTVTIEGVLDDEYTAENTPVYVYHEVPYSSEFFDDYAVLSIYSFYPEGGYTIEEYKAYFETFFLQVKEKKLNNVILDVRNNGGGDPYVTSNLFSYLAKSEQAYFAKNSPDFYPGLKSPIQLADNRFTGNLYTLMNGSSFSSTGHLLALLKSQDIGIFVGEESGGSYACTDASQSTTFSKTKLQFRYSTLVWEVAAKGLTPGQGVMPDEKVSQTIEEYLANQDTVMDYAVRLIKGD